MPPTLVLLRAINVGGTGKVSMADLRVLFAALGYGGARTLLQTGNVVFEAGAGAGDALEQRIEAALHDRLGVSADVLVRSAEEWGALIAANPFAAEAEEAPAFLYAMSLKSAPPTSAVEALRGAFEGRERVELVGRTLYITYPDGAGRSKLTGALIERQLGTRGTARNWNTVLKIEALLRA